MRRPRSSSSGSSERGAGDGDARACSPRAWHDRSDVAVGIGEDVDRVLVSRQVLLQDVAAVEGHGRGDGVLPDDRGVGPTGAQPPPDRERPGEASERHRAVEEPRPGDRHAVLEARLDQQPLVQARRDHGSGGGEDADPRGSEPRPDRGDGQQLVVEHGHDHVDRERAAERSGAGRRTPVSSPAAAAPAVRRGRGRGRPRSGWSPRPTARRRCPPRPA